MLKMYIHSFFYIMTRCMRSVRVDFHDMNDNRNSSCVSQIKVVRCVSK